MKGQNMKLIQITNANGNVLFEGSYDAFLKFVKAKPYYNAYPAKVVTK